MSEAPSLDVMRFLAETSANAAAEKTAAAMREDLRESILAAKQQIAEDINRHMDAYFGRLKPSDHIIQHDRLYRMLGFMDRVSNNFWGKVVVNGLFVVIVVAVVGQFAWGHLVKLVTGFFGG